MLYIRYRIQYLSLIHICVTDVLRATQLRIGYDRPLAEVTFEQKKGQKIGIIGDNGSGKSTLLRTLTGQLEPLGGSFAFGDRVDIGYFEQQMAQYTSCLLYTSRCV